MANVLNHPKLDWANAEVDPAQLTLIVGFVAPPSTVFFQKLSRLLEMHNRPDHKARVWGLVSENKGLIRVDEVEPGGEFALKQQLDHFVRLAAKDAQQTEGEMAAERRKRETKVEERERLANEMVERFRTNDAA